ncbi:hypothetical protein NUH16_010821 [Penicillium rubens]|nr:hypothetical protein NUH16_010821 [Penicillium rubens]
MFAPGQEQISKEEIKAGEIEASQTVQMAIAGGFLLYLCKSSIWSTKPRKSRQLETTPFAVDFVRKFL